MGWAGWLYLAQPVALIGIYGLSLLALLSAALLASGKRRAVFLALALPVSALIYSLVALADGPIKRDEKALKITIVQPNLPQREKWRADLRDRHIEKTFKMTALGLQYAPDTDLIIWPETAIPALIDEGAGFAERLAAALPAGDAGHPPYLLTGAIRRDITALPAHAISTVPCCGRVTASYWRAVTSIIWCRLANIYRSSLFSKPLACSN